MYTMYVCVYNCYLVHYLYTDSGHVYSVPRASTFLTRCNSADEYYYSDSESWLRGNQRTLPSSGSEVNQTLHSDHDSTEEMRNPEIHSIKKKPQVSPRSHKPVATLRKNILPNVTQSHNDNRALDTASANSDDKRYGVHL